ncbi:TPA: Fic family protein [Vibrio cholerae]|nr:Fic family protein [Vibrio cholerae]HCZ9570467.1 Fic family protein [Vibrio cholerae]HCZ9581289.1 Fic family protein [Vibrio cholerae]HCZ9616930.1 Fic family protein [Vibrio cholerae]HCZ9623920.1 Fic family protein [Vibrio cholerae]
MIKRPPKREPLLSNVFEKISKNDPEKLGSYLEYYKPVDSKGRYLPYDEYQYRVASGLDVDLAWSLTKLSRISQYMKLLPLGDDESLCNFMLTPTIQKAISHADRHATTGSLEWMSSKIGEENHFEYLLNDLIEDEAISSSQLEGAATTTLIAKDMLKRKRKPRTPDEKMILGNFKMMKFAWDKRNKPLSVELILDMHREGTDDIDNDKYTPGVFRQTDDVAVVDAEGEPVHIPPSASKIEERLKKIVNWANTCHDDADSSEYIHPMIKAICLHFSIGFEHPFRDGNGRVARSLFYWYMFKNDYAAFRYIAISTLLKSAPVKYGKSYLYTETDDMDLTFFVEYQCGVILRAISKFKEAYKKSLNDIESFNNWIWESGLYKKLSEKQRVVFQVAKGGAAKYFTAVNVKENLGCSYNTAATTLNGLVELGVFGRRKKGREWLFYMLNKQEIQGNWES